MSDVVYTANIKIERVRGPLRYATLPGEDDPVVFSLHSAIAEHYGFPQDHPDTHATTIDYLVAAAGG